MGINEALETALATLVRVTAQHCQEEHLDGLPDDELEEAMVRADEVLGAVEFARRLEAA